MTAVEPVKVEISTDRCTAWVHFHHLGYSDFGRTEFLDHWKLLKMFEAAHFFGFNHGVADLYRHVNHEFGLFIVGVHYEFDPHLWSLHRQTSFPFKISLELQDLGTTSITVFSQLINKLDNRELARCSAKLVYVQRQTGKPVPLPEALHTQFISLLKAKRPLDLPRSPPAVPDSAFTYEVIVAPSDTDLNGHTSHASYICYCCDATQMALRAGAVIGYENDIANYTLLATDVLYTGESNIGHKLHVFVWQDQSHWDHFQFVITQPTKNNPKGLVIFHCSMVLGQKRISYRAHL